MPKIQCNVCDFTPHNPTLWARKNQWFRKHSSLAGALGTQDVQAPSNALKLALFGAQNGHPQYHTRPPQLVTSGSHPPQPSVRPSYQQIPLGVQTAPNNTQQYWGIRRIYCSEVPYTAAFAKELQDARAHVRRGHQDPAPNTPNPAFPQVGTPQYSQQDTQTKRHINGRVQTTRGFSCPNRTGTCPNFHGHFTSIEAVKNHCRMYPACNAAFQANNRKVQSWRMDVTELDLRPTQPQPSQPSQHSDGRHKQKAIQ